MADEWDIKAVKYKRNTLREKIEKRKKERHDILLDRFDEDSQFANKRDFGSADYQAEKVMVDVLSSASLILPIVSTQLISRMALHLPQAPNLETVNYILTKLATRNAITIKNVTIGNDVGCEVIGVEPSVLHELRNYFINDDYESKLSKRKLNSADDKAQHSKTAKNHLSKEQHGLSGTDDIMSLLAMPSTREKQSKQVGEEILELLTKPTAKERSVAEKFKSHGGAQVMEFCPHGTKVECMKAQQATAEIVAKKNKGSNKSAQGGSAELISEVCGDGNDKESQKVQDACSDTEDGEIPRDHLKENEPDSREAIDEGASSAVTDKCMKLHFKKIIQTHTDESLGDCSFLNTCFHMATCKYVHYEVDTLPHINTNKPVDVKTKLSLKRSLDASSTLYPPQWIQCDLRFLDMTVLGKFAVVMADPPWDIHMELPYGTMSDDEMRQLGVPALQDDGLIFLWVTGRAMELGRECLKLWGYERVDEIIWVKTNQLQRIIRTGRTGHWLNHGKEHCLVGMKGNPKDLNRGLDCDVIVAEVRATSHKPDEIYGIIERLSPGTRKIELFGRPHNIQPNWITLGNQLDGIRLVDPELITQFQRRYPDGNCMTPAVASPINE